jgi:hypothetical protein
MYPLAMTLQNPKPTTIYMDDEDRALAAKRRKENGIKTNTGLWRHWLRCPPPSPKAK